MTTNRDSAAAMMTARSDKRDYAAGGRTFPVPYQDGKNSEMIEREVKTAMGGRFGRGSFRRTEAAKERPQHPSSYAGIVLMAVIALILSLTLATPQAAEADTLGPQSPTSGANNATVGTVAWSNPGNIVAADSAFATVALSPSQISNYLVASGMNFAIPPLSTINGIEVSVTRKEGLSNFGFIKDSSIKIVKNGAVTGTEHSAGATWANTTATTVTYGSSTDLWGTTWTVADINAATFGAAIAVTEFSSRGASETAYIDHITITVHYTLLTPCVPGAPSVSITPASRTITTLGGTAAYTVSITNNDAGGCTDVTFNLPVTNSDNTVFAVPALSPVTLAPGASTTIPMNVTAQGANTTGTTNTSVTAQGAGHADVTSNTVTTTLSVVVCSKNTPIVLVTPAAQTITPGGTIDYTVELTNTDSAACTASTFDLSVVSDSNSADFNTPSVLDTPSLNLVPGQAGSAKLTVISKATAPNGAFNDTAIGVSEAGHTAPADVTVRTTVAPTCTPVAPTVSIAPASQMITTDGGTVPYTVTITNNDAAACSSTTFTLPITNSNSADFFVATSLSPVTLAPGATTTVSLTVTAVTGKTTGTTNTSVTATAPGHASVTSNTVTTTLNIVVCVKNTPIIVVTPAAQAIVPGGTIDYTVKVKNTDTSVCPASTFILFVVSDSNSTDFNTPSALETAGLNLAPGQTGTAKLTVISKATAPNGAFNDSAVGLSEAGHTAPADVTVRTTVAPISPLIHNSINTESTKWAADNGWGIPGGKYGEFACKTCHTPETTNIKRIKGTITAPNGTDSFPGSAVVFRSTTTPDGFGDDADLHTTSTKVCEVCHSQTLYHRFNTQDPDGAGPLTGQTVFDHNNSTDCTSCHKHSEAFRASCGSCHANPPVDNAGLVSFPSPTGATAAGAHSKHATSSGYNYTCDTCHFNGMPATPIIEDPLLLQMGFSVRTNRAVYNGRVLQAPYLYDGTNGTTVTTTGSMTCSNVYCHSNGTGGTLNTALSGPPPLSDTRSVAPNTSPSWTSNGPLACTSCHGYPPSYQQDNPKSNSHMYGQFAGDAHRQPCNICHYSTTTDGVTITNPANHANGIYNVDPDPTAIVYGPVNFTYAYDPGGGTCMNNGCHGGPIPWGKVSILAPIMATYGPACYQVQLFPNLSGGTAPYTCTWDFGDGTTFNGCSADHQYASSGPFTVTVSGRDAKNHPYVSPPQNVTPQAVNIPPTVAETVEVSCYTVTLTDLSIDPDYNVCGHAGNAQESINWGNATTSSAIVSLTDSPSHYVFSKTYTAAGTYNITHTVKDNANATVATLISLVKVPSTHTISGRVIHSNGSSFPGVSMLLRQGGSTKKTTTTDANGNYSFTGVNCGSYQVVANRSSYTWSPAQSQSVTVPPDQTVNFTATP